jgi:hypothetical protein
VADDHRTRTGGQGWGVICRAVVHHRHAGEMPAHGGDQGCNAAEFGSAAAGNRGKTAPRAKIKSA